MKYLKAEISNSIIINKSEFITILFYIENNEQIDEYILYAKKKYPKATHYVTAWIRGENAEYASSNDDGEPSRTAGFPTLEVLMHHNLTNILAVTIRYFGGIKLGAGGLIRAYSKSVAEALKIASFYKLFKASKYFLKFPYHLIDKIEHLLGDSVSYINKEYLDKVTYEVVFLKNDINLLKDILHEIELIELEKETLHIDIKNEGN
ncbi:IMPACT family protein [Haploplasma modicum]|uniref:IMPACT family protein n=1 Tax=Haploplasma modicum TaxID=2150 RepID=UPI00047BEB61|nr:YigZ family protein [Haploplasma modicum]